MENNLKVENSIPETDGEGIYYHRLENRSCEGYTTFGAIWEKGQIKKTEEFAIYADNNRQLPLQSRVSAFYPDGSVKWTAHTVKVEAEYENMKLVPISKGCYKLFKQEETGIRIEEDDKGVLVSGGKLEAYFPKKGRELIKNLKISGKLRAAGGVLIGIMEEREIKEDILIRKEIVYDGVVKEVILEEEGPLKCVIKVTGIHQNANTGREILPFIVRFTIYFMEENLSILHTFLYDGEESKDFLKGLGLRFFCPVNGEIYNRHIKLGGDYGYFHEAMQLLLSWRPKLPEDIYRRQLEGKLLEFHKEKDCSVYEALEDITVWNNYHMIQDSAGHYVIKKRTGKEACCYIDSLHGSKGKGIACVSGEDGGAVIGIKHFWEKFPSSLWIDDICKEEAAVTAWIYSPEAEAYDFRHYDTVGHASAYYEGFDEVGSSAFGIANTNEIHFTGFTGSILNDEALDTFYHKLNKPCVLITTPEYYHSKKAFGDWSLPETDTKIKAWIEAQMDLAVEFYKKEIQQRNWYGLFNFGDVMHTYDKERNCWRYDMGGYAWQNTELVPTMWLWYAFLRTGREDIYTLAENMTRHCSEVDSYHLGKYKGIGSRHNVLHWGCSCKEARIAMAGHHRFYYYLTGDHRLEDIFEEVKDGDFSLLSIDPLRYFYKKEEMVYPTHARTGPDWSSFCSNWLTQWERTKEEKYLNKLLAGLEDIKKAPLQLISGSDYEYNPEDGHLRYIGENAAGGSHLTVCMGAAQTWLELNHLLEDKEFEKMLADYGVFYYDEPEVKQRKSKGLIGEREFGLPFMAASLAAFGAAYYKDETLAKKVWDTMFYALELGNGKKGFHAVTVKDYPNRKELAVIPWISTNFVSQWCLNMIYCLEYISEYVSYDLLD